MNVSVRGLAAVIGFGWAALAPAEAATVWFSDNFNDTDGAANGTYALNTAPNNWTVVPSSGTVDWIQDNTYGLRCYGNTGGCVDLDGSTNNAGIMTTGVFDLQAGVTYVLSAIVSGNQRGTAYPALAGPDTLFFGFRDGSGPISGPPYPDVLTMTVSNILSTSPYTLYELIVKPTQDYSDVSIFFEALGGDNVGPMLDNVSLTAVPLPPAAWLLLSGLVGLAAFRRRGVA